MVKEQEKRPHVYELDPLRACTALGVVAVHVLAFTAFLNTTVAGNEIQNAVVVTFHFTREVFIFVTAFALVYVYNGRKIKAVDFWKKRAQGVLLPYIIWTIVYVLVNNPFTTLWTFARTSLFDIVTGNASYQLYYILLTMQFYFFFPFFLPFMRFCARRPWLTLAVSGALQLGFFYLDYHTIQSSNQHIWQSVTYYQDRFFLVYQFYFILGGLTALYFRQIRAFVVRQGMLISGALLVALAALWLHFMLQVRIYRDSIDYASSVLQPIMIFYSVAIIFWQLWLASRWVGKNPQPGERPRGFRFWHTLSEASFGVYLIHALILTALLKWLVPVLPTSWFEPLRVFLVWLLTAGGAMAISIVLMRIPLVSRVVGRSASFNFRRRKRIEPVEPQPVETVATYEGVRDSQFQERPTQPTMPS